MSESLQALSHQRNDPGQPPDDVGRLDVDHAETRIRLLVFDDDPQRSVESSPVGRPAVASETARS